MQICSRLTHYGMYTLVFCRCSVQARLPSLLVGVSVQVRLNSSVNSLLQSSTTTHFLLDCVLNLECMAEDSRRKKNSSEFFWETVWSRFVVTFQRQSNIDLLLVPYHRYTSRRKTSFFCAPRCGFLQSSRFEDFADSARSESTDGTVESHTCLFYLLACGSQRKSG